MTNPGGAASETDPPVAGRVSLSGTDAVRVPSSAVRVASAVGAERDDLVQRRGAGPVRQLSGDLVEELGRRGALVGGIELGLRLGDARPRLVECGPLL